MDPYQETATTWNKLASLYQEKFMNLNLYDATYDFFTAILPADARILDIGCGPGNIAKHMLAQRPDLQWLGVDVAQNMVDLASQNIPQAQFAVMDCREIVQLQSHFEGIVCGFCLPYLNPPDAQKFINDIGEILTENGTLYLSFVAGKPTDSEYKTGSNGARVYFHYYELEALKEQLAEIGFDPPKVFKVDYHRSENSHEVHTVLIAQKKKA